MTKEEKAQVDKELKKLGDDIRGLCRTIASLRAQLHGYKLKNRDLIAELQTYRMRSSVEMAPEEYRHAPR